MLKVWVWNFVLKKNRKKSQINCCHFLSIFSHFEICRHFEKSHFKQAIYFIVHPFVFCYIKTCCLSLWFVFNATVFDTDIPFCFMSNQMWYIYNRFFITSYESHDLLLFCCCCIVAIIVEECQIMIYIFSRKLKLLWINMKFFPFQECILLFPDSVRRKLNKFFILSIITKIFDSKILNDPFVNGQVVRDWYVSEFTGP